VWYAYACPRKARKQSGRAPAPPLPAAAKRPSGGRQSRDRPSLSLHPLLAETCVPIHEYPPPPSETGLWLPSKNTLRVDQAIAVLLEEISCVIDNTQGLTRESFVHAKRFYLVCWQGIMHRRRFDSPSVSRLGMLLCV
jgi:hypothetical protein